MTPRRSWSDDASPAAAGSPVRERGAVLLAAPGAGSEDDAAVAAVEGVLQDAGVDVRTQRSATADDLDEALDGLDGRVPVACGGDGTVHLLVTRLHERGELGRGRAVGLVPLGTGNDLAASVCVPTDPHAAARALLGGRPRPLDLLLGSGDGHSGGQAGEVVLNLVHLGAGAAAAQRGSGLKRWLGPAAYSVGGLVAGVRPPRCDVRVTLDGRVCHDGDALLVGVGVGHRVAGGVHLLPGAILDDGLLDLVVATPRGPVARLAFAASLQRARHLSRADVQSWQGREVQLEVAAGAPPVAADVDGEVTGAVRRWTWRVSPAAWQLLVPRSGDVAG